jgi:glycosyltransferase involved in cell wall biosynthesis
LYLNAFSAHGGIQQYNKNFIVCLEQLKREHTIDYHLCSLSDKLSDIEQSFIKPATIQSASGNKLLFLMKAMGLILKSDLIIIGHVNIAFPLLFFNRFFFKRKSATIIHGIEIWKEYGWLKRKSIVLSQYFFSVSDYTTQRTIEKYKIAKEKFFKITNVLNPDKCYETAISKPDYLIQKYQLNPQDQIMITIARLSKSEHDKGYIKVLNLLPHLHIPNLKYLLIGKYDEEEFEFISQIIKKNGLENKVILTGYVSDDELIAHYQLCDLFVMPSCKEGFGIVFIEAGACGKPSLAGNIDGSQEALLHGATGILINPHREEEIAKAIQEFFEQKEHFSQEKSKTISELVKKQFSIGVMQYNLGKALSLIDRL